MSHPADNPLNLRSHGQPPSKITDFLWIGNAYDALDERFVVDNIHEVVLVGGWHPPLMFPGVAYVHYPLPQPFGIMRPRAQTVIERLEFNETRDIPTLLVCWEGIDRAPTLALKFLKDCFSMSWARAETKIKKKRPVAVPHRDWWAGTVKKK